MSADGIQQQLKIGAVHALMLNQRVALYHILHPVQAAVEATLMSMSPINNQPVTGDRVEAQVQAIIANAGAKRYATKALAKTLNTWEPEDSRVLMLELSEWIKAATVVEEKSANAVLLGDPANSAAGELIGKAGA